MLKLGDDLYHLVFIDEDLDQLLSLLHLPWMQREEEDEPTSCGARAH
jgi:hypothetical protein